MGKAINNAPDATAMNPAAEDTFVRCFEKFSDA
jgi:hypothetical protein